MIPGSPSFGSQVSLPKEKFTTADDRVFFLLIDSVVTEHYTEIIAYPGHGERVESGVTRTF